MISIKNIIVGYSRKKLILNDVSLDLTKGNVYGLFGQNGSGKTTLLKVIAGLIYPSGGEINIMGYHPCDRMKNYIKEIIYMPDDIELPKLTFSSFVSVYSKFYDNFSYDQLNEYVTAFGIDKTVVMSKQSFGQKKKLYISFILACNTKLLIMDEPTNGLDTVSKKIFKKIMASVIDDNKIIIISTHQTVDLKDIISGIVVIKDNNILCSTIDNIMDKLYFGSVVETDDPIYSEGVSCIFKNVYGLESEINLELLVNSICLSSKCYSLLKQCSEINELQVEM